MIFFILGKNSALSAAEIANVYKDAKIYIKKDAVLLDKNFDNGQKTVDRLGGVIKGGEIISEMPLEKGKLEAKKIIINYIFDLVDKNKLSKDKKIYFGVSAYGRDGKLSNKGFIKFMAMELKEKLKGKNINSRWVISNENELSSVVVQKNGLFREKNGIEIILFEEDKCLYIGETLAVQDFQKYSKFDYGRPIRDARSGMLPPKLSKMMLNIAGVERKKTILDPFCGSGTILQEALLMGYEDIIGSDLKKEAIDACEKNLEWLKTEVPELIKGRNLRLMNVSSEKLSGALKKNSCHAIITEPYLGPPIRKDCSLDIAFIIKNLSKLYLRSFKQFKEILVPGGVVVMAWPVFKAAGEGGEKFYRFMPLLDEVRETGFEMVRLMPYDLMQIAKTNFGKGAISKRETFIYAREDQFVLREIVKFKKV
ncbi:MAG: DNA methyltransferase [bacterium]